jgi:hypothetical protein
MHFVFLDEFGHIGPFVARNHVSYSTSPVFGVAGCYLPERQVREFATWFYKFKYDVFEQDIKRATRHRATWEKKGNEIFTSGHVYKTKRIGYTLINTIQKFDGKIFFHGIEKHEQPQHSNPTGLYYTVLRHAIRDLERCFANKAQNFLIILDEHQSRVQLLESAVKTMFGSEYPARHLLEPPYQVESHLYQTIQAADWIAAIVGPLLTYRIAPQQFADREWAEKYFGKRIDAASTHSKITPRPRAQLRLLLKTEVS